MKVYFSINGAVIKEESLVTVKELTSTIKELSNKWNEKIDVSFQHGSSIKRLDKLIVR